jgi:hypothetical protein
VSAAVGGVPEPSTWMLSLLGFLGLGLLARNWTKGVLRRVSEADR